MWRKAFLKRQTPFLEHLLERGGTEVGWFSFFVFLFPPEWFLSLHVLSTTFSRKELLFCVINGNVQIKPPGVCGRDKIVTNNLRSPTLAQRRFRVHWEKKSQDVSPAIAIDFLLMDQ